MFQLGGRFGKWSDRFKLIFARPGWKPAEHGGYQSTPPLEKQDLNHYDAKNSKAFMAYVVTQFMLMLGGLVALMTHYKELRWYYQVAFLAMIIVTGMICGAILENRRWVLVAEYIRLALVIVLLNVVYYELYVDWLLYVLVGSGVGFVVFNLWFTLGWVFQRKRQMQFGAAS